MNEYVNQAMAMMQKVITAATPIAKQAWEISLLTLQIDALATMVPILLLVVGSVVAAVFLLCFHRGEIAAYNTAMAMWKEQYKTDRWQRQPDKSDYTVFDGFYYCLTWFVCLLPGVIGLALLCNVWLWVKLFAPELWLAHVAIEKLVK